MLLHCHLPLPSTPRPKVCAVSYLNTVPLVWGMTHGPQQGLFDLMFRVPSECADLVASGAADIGIVPSFELTRQDLAIVPGVGIACRGPVRSILLVSRCPAAEIRTLAADVSSRSSVALARIVLKHYFGAAPQVLSRPPRLQPMLEEADAALIIGDPALHLDPSLPGFHVYDLGGVWTDWTGLPMVFAVWAGRREVITPEVIAAFQESCRFGLDHLEDIVTAESAGRGLAPELVRDYLGTHIVCELGAAESAGMELYLRYVREL